MSLILETFLSTIREQSLIKSGDRIIVGLSGGADSLCLLEFLLSVQKKYNLELALAHVNYALRGSESDEEEDFVRTLSISYNLPAFIRRESINSNGNIQEKARNIRFLFFKEIISNKGYDKLALGHNLDDFIENFFLRLCKGSLLKGLSSFSYKNNLYGIAIVRPLLDIAKKDIISHLGNRPYKVDSSNLEAKYKRNELRLKVLPILETVFPFYRKALSKTIAHLRDDSNYIQRQVENKIKALEIERTDNVLKLDLIAFKELISDLQYRILREGASIMEQVILSQKAIADMLNKIASVSSGGSFILFRSGNFLIYIEYNLLVFALEDNLIHIVSPIHIVSGKTYKLASYDLKMEDIKLTDFNFKTFMEKVDNRAFICLDKEKTTSLSIRSFMDGDRIYFNKTLAYKKVKEVLIDKKFPRFKRNEILILLDNDKPIGILSLHLSRLSECYYINSSSELGTRITLSESH